MNKVILMGRLVADPVLAQTSTGIASCRFRIAVDRKFADKTTGERQADFFNCIAWKQTAEFVSRYFTKGKLIAIDGSIRNSNYQDKKYPDITHYSMDIIVDNVEFVGGKNENGGSQGGNSGYQNNGYNAPQNGYNNNNNYQAAPPQAQRQSAPANEDMSYGSTDDFEEIIGDGDVPF